MRMPFRLSGLIVLWGISLLYLLTPLHVLSQNDVLRVGYLPPSEELDEIKEYNLELLNLALKKTEDTDGAFEVIYKESTLSQRDALMSLRGANMLYVVPTMTDRYREKVYHSVHIPLYKGLFGVRMLMMHPNNRSKLAGVKNKKQLSEIKMGQGFDWPDTQILKANEFNVDEYRSKTELLNALMNGEITLYPRAVIEIWAELEQPAAQEMTYHRESYLYYPTAIYYFTQKTEKGKQLTNRLTRGLDIAIEDGSFDTLFNKYWKPLLDKASLNEMTPIKLNNPLLPEGVPVDQSKYWYVD